MSSVRIGISEHSDPVQLVTISVNVEKSAAVDGAMSTWNTATPLPSIGTAPPDGSRVMKLAPSAATSVWLAVPPLMTSVSEGRKTSPPLISSIVLPALSVRSSALGVAVA